MGDSQQECVADVNLEHDVRDAVKSPVNMDQSVKAKFLKPFFGIDGQEPRFF